MTKKYDKDGNRKGNEEWNSTEASELDEYVKAGLFQEWQKWFILRTKSLLRQNELSQKDLGEFKSKSGKFVDKDITIGTSTLSNNLKYERIDLSQDYKGTKRGLSAPSVNSLFLIAERFNVSIPYLLGIDKTSQPQYADAHSTTGLSEKSLKFLAAHNKKTESAIIDTVDFLCSKKGRRILYLISSYLNSSACEDFDTDSVWISDDGRLYGDMDRKRYSLSSELTDFLLINIMYELKSEKTKRLDASVAPEYPSYREFLKQRLASFEKKKKDQDGLNDDDYEVDLQPIEFEFTEEMKKYFGE